MKKKAVKYTIIFLIVPLILSLMIAIATGNKVYNDDTGYDGMNISSINGDASNYEIKRSNGFIYFSLFTLIVISGGALIYIKQKRDI